MVKTKIKHKIGRKTIDVALSFRTHFRKKLGQRHAIVHFVNGNPAQLNITNRLYKISTNCFAIEIMTNVLHEAEICVHKKDTTPHF